MTRLGQFGILSIVLGAVALLLGLFPYVADLDNTPGVGASQIIVLLASLFLLVLGGYTVIYAVLQANHPRTLLRDVATRLGMTGLVIAFASVLADVMGFGSHGAGTQIGAVQAGGMLVGFGIAALGVMVYGLSASRR